MQIIKDKKELSYICRQIKQSKAKISFVPTMGMIHRAHLELIKMAKAKGDFVIVSIFVNPKQFDNNSDFVKYPRAIDDDISKINDCDADLIFIPETNQFYTQDFAFNIEIHKLADLLCGATRNGHMNGVCIVLMKLFNLIRPDFVIMGEKDYQQLYITKKLAEDFDCDTTIIGCPTIRDENGLAMSSRNKRLSKDSLNLIAPLLYKNLLLLRDDIIKSNYNFDDSLIKEYKDILISNGFEKIDYLEILNNNLTRFSANDTNGRIFIAAWLDNVRLIDNIKL
ncbi:MAG: pantoate--beta-alanine ligase [Rickettsiales bacterium]|nr:pantoate--beta-alanine ligase [Rickettsiales bacterium]